MNASWLQTNASKNTNKSFVKDEKAILEVYNEYCRITEKSSDKQCAICQEIVWEKVDDGILNNCSLVFCFECISHFWFTNDDSESQLPPEMENFIYQRFLYKYQRSKFL